MKSMFSAHLVQDTAVVLVARTTCAQRPSGAEMHGCWCGHGALCRDIDNANATKLMLSKYVRQPQFDVDACDP